jgi:hypothetical protein
MGICYGMLYKRLAIGIVKTDSITKNWLVNRLRKAGNLRTPRGKLHPYPVANQVNGDYGSIEPSAAVVWQDQGNFLFRITQGLPSGKSRYHCIKALQVLQIDIYFYAAFSMGEASVSDRNGNQFVPLFLDLCYQAVHPFQSFFNSCHFSLLFATSEMRNLVLVDLENLNI